MKFDRTFQSPVNEQSLEIKLGKRLADLRIAAKFSQRSLAARLKIGEKLYSSWESGSRIGLLQFRFLIKIANFYHLTIAEIFDETVEAKYAPIARICERPQKFHSLHLPNKDHSLCVPGSKKMCSECRELWSESKKTA